MIKNLLMFVFSLSFVGLAPAADPAPHGHDDHPIRVHEPFVRLLPPTQPNTGAFMVLENSGDRDLALVRAESDVARVVELHDHIKFDGVMQMRKIEKIGIPAGKRTELRPGGLHVMLIGLQRPLQEGQQVPITLIFSGGSRRQIIAPVRHPGDEMPRHGQDSERH